MTEKLLPCISKEQAQAFIDTLWPCSEYTHLSSHSRTYFEALLGKCPCSLHSYTDEQRSALKIFASILRQIADHIDGGANA